jgi:tRNA pseudouridine38-40 synthase
MSLEFPPKQKPYSRNCEILKPGVFPEGMTRVALGVEYNGARFHGFQSQPHTENTVQGRLQQALSKVADEEITSVCAGRTDAGVHATNQVIHFDTLAQRPDKAWVMGVNTKLPDEISVRWACRVPETFHARFSARQRTYRYLICNTASRPALGVDQLTWDKRSLDHQLMHEAAQVLVGRHDFSSFRASLCQAKSPVRTIDYVHVVRRGDLIVLEIRANAFLHHMVRNIVGTLLAVGSGEKPLEWLEEVLLARDRNQAGVTAKPNGLHLVWVDYPQEVELPIMNPGPMCVPEPLGGLIK